MKYCGKCLAVVCAIAVACTIARAQSLPPYFTANTNAGTEFYLSFLPAWPVSGGLNAIKIMVVSAVATSVTVEVEAEGFSRTQQVQPYVLTEFVLPVTVAQPYFKDDRGVTPASALYKGKAVHVVADDPVVVYGITRYQYTSDGFTALPVSALDTDYSIASYADVGDNGNSAGQYLPSLASVVAVHDNTRVSFTLGGNPVTKLAGSTLEPGQSITITMNKGDVYSFGSSGHAADLSGSRIEANKPVGVISGNFCAYIPLEAAACDHILEMETPMSTWGTEYVVTHIAGRQRNSLIKIMAKEPNTSIFRNGQKIGVISTAGGIEGLGYMARRVYDGDTANVVITADKPICVTQFNPGHQDDNVASDPFQLVLAPVNRYTREVIFSTPGTGDGSGFARNYINIVFALDEKGHMPSDMEFGVQENGQMVWSPVAIQYGAQFEPLATEIAGRAFGVKTILLPGDGVYRLRSSAPLHAVLYGFSDYDSYAMPAGLDLAVQRVVDSDVADTVAPLFSFADTCVASRIISGRVSDRGTDSRKSGLAKVQMLAYASTNYTWTGSEVIVGRDTAAQWTLEVVDSTLAATAVLLATDRSGNVSFDMVTYSPRPLLMVPVRVGNVRIDSSLLFTVPIRNTHSAAIVIDTLYLAQGLSFSFVSPPEFPVVLQPNAVLSLDVRFTPAFGSPAEVQRYDTVRAEFGCGSAVVGTIHGAAVAPRIAVADVDFGLVPVNEQKCTELTIRNIGTGPLTITAVEGLEEPFSLLDPEFTLPMTIPPGETVTLKPLCFAPVQAGTYMQQLVFVSDAMDGLDPIAFLAGEASPSVDVAEDNSRAPVFGCWPNPASDILMVYYTLPVSAEVRIELYNIAGEPVRAMQQQAQAGRQSVEIPLGTLPAGVYLCRLLTPQEIQVRHITIAR